ncbi:hypothetical protein F4810DRAFT_711994 [Camillea tinctor]|nr:hypothetical protein F4810DRAFT_711994 [Camillea tinctor]
MKFSIATIVTFVSLALAAPEPNNQADPCGSKYNSCGAPHQPPCCAGLNCASGTCI